MAAAHPVLHPPFSERVVYDRTAATRTELRAPRDPGARYAGIAFTILVHVALIAALLQYAPVQRALAKVKPIMVSVITPQPSPPEPARPKQKVAAKTVRTQAPPPVEKVAEPPSVAAQTTATSPITLPVVEPPPAPVAQAAVAPEPPPIIPPRFNADYLQNPAPAYPPLARRMHEQGKVLIRVLVSVDGMPEKIELKASSGYPRLDQSALETIRNWKFVPARQGDQKVTAWVIVPITFTLDA